MNDEEGIMYLTNVKVANWNGSDQDDATTISIVVPGGESVSIEQS